jgi:hypothetical protein
MRFPASNRARTSPGRFFATWPTLILTQVPASYEPHPIGAAFEMAPVPRPDMARSRLMSRMSQGNAVKRRRESFRNPPKTAEELLATCV